jgi:hypothetical protein
MVKRLYRQKKYKKTCESFFFISNGKLTARIILHQTEPEKKKTESCKWPLQVRGATVEKAGKAARHLQQT